MVLEVKQGRISVVFGCVTGSVGSLLRLRLILLIQLDALDLEILVIAKAGDVDVALILDLVVDLPREVTRLGGFQLCGIFTRICKLVLLLDLTTFPTLLDLTLTFHAIVLVDQVQRGLIDDTALHIKIHDLTPIGVDIDI